MNSRIEAVKHIFFESSVAKNRVQANAIHPEAISRGVLGGAACPQDAAEGKRIAFRRTRSTLKEVFGCSRTPSGAAWPQDADNNVDTKAIYEHSH